jgi:hypothetical protein
VESCLSGNAATNFDGCSAGIVPFQGLALYCAYHQNTATSTMIFYANMPFDADNSHCQDFNYPNGLISDGEINGGLSHEHMESSPTRFRTMPGPTEQARTTEQRSATSATVSGAIRSVPPRTAPRTTR